MIAKISLVTAVAAAANAVVNFKRVVVLAAFTLFAVNFTANEPKHRNGLGENYRS
jgi:hypothetical protein